MTLKVYQGGVIDWERSSEKYHGQCCVCVAAHSWKEAHAIVSKQYRNQTLGHMRGYWTVTGNPAQLKAALSKPGVMFISASLSSDEYKEWK